MNVHNDKQIITGALLRVQDAHFLLEGVQQLCECPNRIVEVRDLLRKVALALQEVVGRQS